MRRQFRYAVEASLLLAGSEKSSRVHRRGLEPTDREQSSLRRLSCKIVVGDVARVAAHTYWRDHSKRRWMASHFHTTEAFYKVRCQINEGKSENV